MISSGVKILLRTQIFTICAQTIQLVFFQCSIIIFIIILSKSAHFLKKWPKVGFHNVTQQIVKSLLNNMKTSNIRNKVKTLSENSKWMKTIKQKLDKRTVFLISLNLETTLD